MTEIVLDADSFQLLLDVVTPRRNKQRVCCQALCGIHLGQMVYLNASSAVRLYTQYFERALFESQVSLHDMIYWIEYVQCLNCGFGIL